MSMKKKSEKKSAKAPPAPPRPSPKLRSGPPVAVRAKIVHKNDKRSYSANGQEMRWCGQVFLGPIISGTGASGEIIKNVLLSPLMSGNSNLAALAKVWSKFRINSMELAYTAAVGTGTNGLLGFYIEANPTAPLPDSASFAEACQAHGRVSREINVWDSGSLRMKCMESADKKWLVQQGSSSAYDYAQGRILVGCIASCAASTTYGVLWADVDISFYIQTVYESIATASLFQSQESNTSVAIVGSTVYNIVDFTHLGTGSAVSLFNANGVPQVVIPGQGSAWEVIPGAVNHHTVDGSMWNTTLVVDNEDFIPVNWELWDLLGNLVSSGIIEVFEDIIGYPGASDVVRTVWDIFSTAGVACGLYGDFNNTFVTDADYVTDFDIRREFVPLSQLDGFGLSASKNWTLVSHRKVPGRAQIRHWRRRRHDPKARLTKGSPAPVAPVAVPTPSDLDVATRRLRELTEMMRALHEPPRAVAPASSL
jgi:hypothetical protein